MKTIKTTLLTIAALLCSISASAYDFEADGIAYTFISVQERRVCVDGITSSSGGDIVIPDKVLFNDYWFSVDSIATLSGSRNFSSIKFNSLIKTDGHKLYGCGTAFFYVDESNPYLTAIDGVLYNKDMTRLICFPPNKNCEEFSIPESVVSIDDYSFGTNRFIKRLIFNDNIEELPENFLYGDYGSLKYLKLSDKIKVIHGRCLYDVSSLEEIILPKSLEEVERDQYYRYYGLPTNLLTVTISNSKIANYVYTLEPSLYVFSRFEKLKNLHVKDSNPVAIDDNVFTEGQYFTINLYVPKGTKEIYKNLGGWKNFYNIIEENGETIKKEKCLAPSICYENGRLSFVSETEGTECVATISDNDVKTHYGNEISLTTTYTVNVYATKKGYENSETATATLCWIECTEKHESEEGNGVINIPSVPILIQSQTSIITITGLADGTVVSVYSVDGKEVGNTTAINGTATINTSLQTGDMAIIKIGTKSVKVIVK